MMNNNVVDFNEFGSREASPKSVSSNKLKFTDATIKHLKSQDKRVIYWCCTLSGFGLRITPKGTKTWIFIFKFNGVSKMLTIGNYPKLSLAQARESYFRLKEKVDKGVNPIEEKVEEKKAQLNAMTIDCLLTKYIEYCIERGEKNWKEKKRALNRDFIPEYANVKVKDISFRDIAKVVNSVFIERKSSETARHLLSYLRTMFKYAKNGLGLIETNPCADLEPPEKKGKKEPRFLSPREIYLFWNNVENANMADVIKLGMRFMLCTLQRGAEVRALEWSEINREEKTWIIPADKAKNGTVHLVPLNNHAIEILNKIYPKTGHSKYVFGYSQIWKMNPNAKADLKPMGVTAFNHSSRVNFECYGIEEYFTPHELRKTGATTLTSVSFSREIVKKLLNHKSNDVTAVYDLFDYFEEKRAGMEIMNYVLERILSSQSVEYVPSIKTLRREVVTKGLIHEYMKEDYYSSRKLENSMDFQTTLPSPVSYTLSSSLNV